MIDYIEGKLIEKNPTFTVIDCNGVGYLLHISLNTFTKIPDSGIAKLFAYTAIREDAHTLYGFIDRAERALFLQLISVSGVGANTARMMLSSLAPEELQTAILNGNVAVLQKIKGIGLKTAQRIIVDLRDKLSKDVGAGEILIPLNNRVKEEALSALVMLGFAKNVAEKALEKVAQGEGTKVPVEQMIKLALKFL
jgi:holliday junction DNA helicase RuvA